MDQKSVRITINVDGREERQRALQVLVMNSPYYGWSLLLWPEVTMTDGLLDVVVFPRVGRWALMRSFITVWRGGTLPTRPVVYRATRIKIASDEPVAAHADAPSPADCPRSSCAARERSRSSSNAHRVVAACSLAGSRNAHVSAIAS